MIKKGSFAPEFEFPDQHERVIRLTDFKDNKNIVIFFFESSLAPVCINELEAFNKAYSQFSDLDTVIIGVSSDDVISLNLATAKRKLHFSLVSDISQQIRKLFHVRPRFGSLPGRVTYVIDKKGLIQNVISSVFESKVHVEESLKSIRELEIQMGRY